MAVQPIHFKHLSTKSLGKLLVAGVFAVSLAACSGKTPEDHIAQAQVFIDAGDNAAAIVELKSAVQQSPRLAQARFELGKVYIAEKNYESAEKELSRALELGHPAAAVIPLLSEAYQRTGANVALADLEFDESSLTSVERLEVGYRKLQSLLQLEKNGEARVLIDELSPIDSSSVYKGLIEAHRDILDKDYESALEQAKVLHERAPLNRDILSFTARLYMLNGQEKEAAELYEDYTRVATDDIESKFALANMLVQQGEMKRAEVYVDELMQISDTNPLLNQLKGIIRAAQEDFENGLYYSEQAIAFGRGDPRIRMVAGFSAFRIGEFEKAVGHLSIVAPLLPDGHPALRILAASQLQSDLGTDASEVLTRIGEVSASDASLFSKAGFELIQEGNIDAAKEVIDQADKISETADDLTRLGILKLSVNNIEGLLNLEQAVDKAPDSFTAKATLASAYLGTDQLDKAMNLAKEWQSNSPMDVQGYLLEAEVLQRQEQFDEASRLLDQVAQIDAENSALLVAKIRLLLRQQKTEEAMAVTEQLLQLEPANALALASYFAIMQSDNKAQAGLQKIETAFEQNPENVSIALLTARAALASNEAKVALNALNSIEASRSAPNQYWVMKGAALLRDNQIDAAEKHYQQWAEMFPSQENAVLGRLLILDGKRDFEKGLDVASKFLAREDNLQVSFLQSYFYVMSGEPEQAQTALNNIDEQYHPLPFLRGVKARIAVLQGRAADAVDDALVSYEDNKKSDNLFILVQSLQASGQSDRAFDVVEQHVKEFPNDMRAKLLYAERLMNADQSNAMRVYREMLEINPNNFVALNNLAYMLMQAGDLASAADLAKKAYDIRPDNVATVDTYAQVLIKQGKVEEAIEVYNKVMNDKVSNEEIVLNYIEALLRNGSKVIASRRLDAFELTSEDGKARAEALKNEYNL